jgi:hypothetical protein
MNLVYKGRRREGREGTRRSGRGGDGGGRRQEMKKKT